MSATLNGIRAATDRVQQAETQLEELAAMVALNRLVEGLTRTLFTAALREYRAAEVGRAVGLSRQAMARRRTQKRAGAQADPSPVSPLDERNPSDHRS